MNIKEAIKSKAYELGADLVGIGSVDRCWAAPVMMSPQGVFPGSKSVVVMALHHPDACIEIGGESHPQNIGPYSVQYLMNSRLDEMSYKMACFIEDMGYGAIPIASSNIWRYNSYKSLNAVFAPDVSNIYMAVTAGLADMGYSGIAITPEYGARNRFVTVITDLEMEPDPLIPPGTVCDKCMLCRKHCPSAALSKELNGDKVLKIGGNEYRFANKNLWRCAWGEHFDLSLDLEIPDVVTEEVIIETVKKYGVRSGEMGQCLKFCVPSRKRKFDPSYSKTPLRKPSFHVDEELESRALTDRLLNKCYEKGAEYVGVFSAEELTASGMSPEVIMPGVKSVIAVASKPFPKELVIDSSNSRHAAEVCNSSSQYGIDSICFDLTRELDELGFRSMMTIEKSGSHPDPMSPNMQAAKLAGIVFDGKPENWLYNFVYTSKSIPPRPINTAEGSTACGRPEQYRGTTDLKYRIKQFAIDAGADICGVASAERVDAIARQLMPFFDGEPYFEASDKSIRFTEYKPEIRTISRKVLTTSDYLEDAKSVIVFGLRYNEKVLEFAAKPPAEAVGPYAFQSYVTVWQGTLTGSRIVRKLLSMGYKAVMTTDLTGLGTAIASPRGYIEDAFSNRFEAIAAGLAGITRSGRPFTPEFGIRQRFIAVITNAELIPDELLAVTPELCETCGDKCAAVCPTAAISGTEVRFTCEGRDFSFLKIDENRCDWSKRYAIAGESGFKYLGSKLDELPPEEGVTPESLGNALRKHDIIKKYRPVVCEPCVIKCPYSTKTC